MSFSQDLTASGNYRWRVSLDSSWWTQRLTLCLLFGVCPRRSEAIQLSVCNKDHTFLPSISQTSCKADLITYLRVWVTHGHHPTQLLHWVTVMGYSNCTTKCNFMRAGELSFVGWKWMRVQQSNLVCGSGRFLPSRYLQSPKNLECVRTPLLTDASIHTPVSSQFHIQHETRPITQRWSLPPYTQ